MVVDYKMAVSKAIATKICEQIDLNHPKIANN
jgi:hypothetical protein